MKSIIVRAQMLRMINAFHRIIVARGGSDHVFADALTEIVGGRFYNRRTATPTSEIRLGIVSMSNWVYSRRRKTGNECVVL